MMIPCRERLLLSHLSALSPARLDSLARDRGPAVVQEALARFEVLVVEEGRGLVRALEAGGGPEACRRAFLLEGAALEIGGQRLARCCRLLIERPAAGDAAALVTEMLTETLAATAQVRRRYAPAELPDAVAAPVEPVS
ncbi:hypothetical protein ACFQPS_06400 [Rhodocista pekingensis]|uniref:Uncharacterized protein n=2 Tax=Rhodocista pekingensis TaxID=201185 RepID=A0ABW2KS13_9PROT